MTVYISAGAVKLLSRMLSAVEGGLEGREFLSGTFSGADIMTGHACTVAARLGADISDKPKLAAYINSWIRSSSICRRWCS